jgi:hypothetical protein
MKAEVRETPNVSIRVYRVVTTRRQIEFLFHSLDYVQNKHASLGHVGNSLHLAFNVSYLLTTHSPCVLCGLYDSAYITMSIPMAVRSKPYVCGRLIAGIAGSNPADGINVRLLRFCMLCR